MPACGGTSSGKPQVAVITNNSASFWSICEAGARKAAKDKDVELIFRMPEEGKVSSQRPILDAVLKQGAAGLALAIDVASPEEIRTGVLEVVQRFGRLDILVNCAAIYLVDPLLEVTPDRWDQVFDINARGAFYCMTSAAEMMLPRKFGRIITITTPATRLATPLFATYAASKGGLTVTPGNSKAIGSAASSLMRSAGKCISSWYVSRYLCNRVLG